MKKAKMKYRLMQSSGQPAKIYLYDDITAQEKFNWNTWEYEESETSAKHFMKLLQEIPDGTDIEVHINSYGGEVKEGIAIYNLLKQKNCSKVCYIDCFAYSVAYVPAMACDKIVMGLGSSIMIHNMWTVTAGNAAQLRKEADDLDVLMQANRQIFLERVNISEDELIKMMDAETILSPDECLEYGFCDEISKTEIVESGDREVLNQKMIKQLRLQMSNQQTLLEYSKQFYSQGAKPSPAPAVEPKAEETENKSLKMMGDFFNALTKLNIKKNQED